jgi:hypothetical protein
VYGVLDFYSWLLQEIAGLDLNYVKVNDAALDLEIKDQVRAFQDLQVAGKSNGEVVVSFYEKKLRTSGWFSAAQQEEKVCWERWTLRFRFTGLGPRGKMGMSPKEKTQVTEQVTRRIYYILKFVKMQQEHIPPIQQSKTALNFPYSIEVPQAASGSVWESIFKKL